MKSIITAMAVAGLIVIVAIFSTLEKLEKKSTETRALITATAADVAGLSKIAATFAETDAGLVKLYESAKANTTALAAKQIEQAEQSEELKTLLQERIAALEQRLDDSIAKQPQQKMKLPQIVPGVDLYVPVETRAVSIDGNGRIVAKP